MKELDSWMKVFGVITDSARRNVLITFISIILVLFLASVYLNVQTAINRNDDKEKLYERIIEEVKREQQPTLERMENTTDHTQRNIEQTILKADTILTRLEKLTKEVEK